MARPALGVLVFAALSAAACADEPVVPLLQLTGVAPQQVEQGDVLEIDGAAFPQGRRAHVSFEGVFHRPGMTVDSPDVVDAVGVVAQPTRIDVQINDAFIGSFCGIGSNAAHTSFDGSVTVVFAADAPGAPPVSGRLERVSIDVVPTARGTQPSAAIGREIGVTLEDGQPAVKTVEPTSVAAKAGITAGDVIVVANGVRVLGPGDLTPSPDATALDLVVRAANGAEKRATIALEGRRGPSGRFALPALLVASVALLLGLLAASPTRLLVWVRRRMKQRPRARPALLYAQVAGVVTACTLPLLGPGADIALLGLVIMTGVLAVALLSSGWRAAVVAMSRAAPTVVALALALAVAGSLRADELTAAQGSAPWRFFALRSPAHAVLAVVGCGWPVLRERQQTARLDVLDRFVWPWVAAALVVVFFGGFGLPSLPAHPHGAGGLASAVFLVKTALLSGFLLHLGDALPPLSLRKLAGLAWLRLVPVAVAAGVGAALWERHMASHASSVAVGLAAAALALGVVFLWPRAASAPRTDPLA